jgi:hypothetical protein
VADDAAGVGPPFHPSVPSSVHPSKFFIPEEEDDGRVYSYKEIGVSVLMQLFLIGWSGWWDGQHRGNQGKLKNILH